MARSVTSFGALFLTLAIFILSAAAERRARLVPQRRTDYNGGWALAVPGSTCPADASVACSTNGGYVNPTCCPSGQTCFGYASPYCCPSNTDCSNVVSNFPVCADPTWNLYEYDLDRNQFFCCPSGQYGILPISGDAGICKPTNEGVASSLVATPATQYGGGTVATTMVGGGGAASPTTTLTKTSTLNGGAVTTIVTAVGGSASTATSTSGSGSSGSGSSGTSKSTKKMILSAGAIAGIAIGGLVLIVATLCFCFLKRRSAKKSKEMGSSAPMPYVGGSGGGLEGQQSGGAPLYAPVPSPYGAAVREYKSPAIGVEPRQYGYGGTPPPQPGYGHTPPPPLQQGIYGPPPAEAPQRWDGRAEMEGGRREI